MRQTIAKSQQVCDFISKIEMKKTIAVVIPTEVMDFKSILIAQYESIVQMKSICVPILNEQLVRPQGID